ncbi:interleukin-17 receptor A [Austrofundulus limnaeus]|uniref:Interleukin-17 receptor A n=1 Tax=Austrofundulus limnaeus TaxID=52670 RepID=A0A2I4C5D7_AUSLI|nr:PREDICTED: interleukin-17 receptor A-like [Austrofundulus limnaeus]
MGHYRIAKQITVPGCNNKKIQKAQTCQENGSLWDPSISAGFIDERSSVFVAFAAAQYSERYQVSIQIDKVDCSKMISKESRSLLNVTFEDGSCRVLHCKMLVKIQPFFVGCKNNCEVVSKNVTLCHNDPPHPARQTCIRLLLVLVFTCCLLYLLWRTCRKGPLNPPISAEKQQPEVLQVQERKRVFIIYSLDHPLYKNIVLRFCAFLVTKCGTGVIIDLLDSTRLGELGSIQWLDWHKEQIESSSDKILILCSRGVQAKWRAMCGDKQVFLKEDARSPMGDMLTPSLALMVPHFIRSKSFEKFIVAYFDGICSEEDVPSPFNITVRYKLMKQFEEVFFRILNTEKHEPGRVKQINGLSEDKYHECPSGRALHDAIQAFHAYQLEKPQWFEEELLESSDLEEEEVVDDVDENNKTFTKQILYCVLESNQVVSHVEIEETGFTVNNTELQLSEFNFSNIATFQQVNGI